MSATLTARLGLGTVFVLLAVCGCGGDGPMETPMPGPLNLRLTTPNGDDGAILFDVTGGAIDSIAREGFRVVASAPGTSPRRAIINGNLAAGTVARIWVRDVNKVGSYSATIREVAARGTYALRDLQGYRIEVVKP
jgi:hypothetical protein